MPRVEYQYEMEVNEVQLEGFELVLLDFLIRRSLNDADYLRSTPACDRLWNFPREVVTENGHSEIASGTFW